MTSTPALDIGGQAVIEGVMIKSRHKLAVAVRLENGQIKIKKEKLKPLPRVLRLPFIRGFATLFHITLIGIEALLWSAHQAVGEEERLGWKEIAGTLLVSMIFGLVLFLGVPLLITELSPVSGGFSHLFEGIVRLLIFLIYVYAISFMSDVHRLFQYHGAEHMAANCYEYGEALTVENVQKYSTVHPRCGTSFIMLVLIISVILFSFISVSAWYEKLIWRLALLPVVAGVSYEILRFSGRFRNSRFALWLVAPGQWVQKITTQKPTKRMVEVAIASLDAVTK